ncbi:cytochrome P450 [Violaceomyces palustris]|uniref:Cytochrome P450 n=1 Tax=Violaceomyces palustris TaxID=1673888 RepID=A0ACD0NS79_9BASI|nr:cytochrome P450 [Violaceomyces palustris]
MAIALDASLTGVLHHLVSHPFLTIFALLASKVLYDLYLRSILFPSPYSHLPGPQRVSRLIGNRVVEATGLTVKDEKTLVEKRIEGPGKVLEYYRDHLGSSCYLFPDAFMNETIFLSDPHAMAHVLSDVDTFRSDEIRTRMINFMVGNGIVSRFGEAHRRQRRLLAPAFTPANLKDMTGSFLHFGKLMNRKIDEVIERGGDEPGSGRLSKGTAKVDLASWLDCATLDIIGSAGFGYDFKALERGRENNELSKCFNTLIEIAMDFGALRSIHLAFSAVFYPPACTWPISSVNRINARMNKTIQRFAAEIVAEKRENIKKQSEVTGTLEEAFEGRKDILSLLIKADMEASSKDKLKEEEITGQIQTMIFAGYETSAVTLSWALHYLSNNQAIQSKLRSEIRKGLKKRRPDQDWDQVTSSEMEFDYDDLWSEELEYLEWVLLEILRLNTPVVATERLAVEDNVIPLMKPVRSRDGQSLLHQIHVRKGTNVSLGLATCNMSAELYGEDVDQFIPERWAKLPELHSKARLPPFGMFTFIGGPKSCIGSRFSLTEMKALLILLLQDYEFHPCQDVEIVRQQSLVVRPKVKGRESKKAALPLLVKKLG